MCKGVLWLCEKQEEEILNLRDNGRTWRNLTGDREWCKMMKKAATGASFPPTVSRIEVRILDGWMN